MECTVISFNVTKSRFNSYFDVVTMKNQGQFIYYSFYWCCIQTTRHIISVKGQISVDKVFCFYLIMKKIYEFLLKLCEEHDQKNV